MTSPTSQALPHHEPTEGGPGPLEMPLLAQRRGSGIESGPGPRGTGDTIAIDLSSADGGLRDEWAAFLCRYEWDVFATLTYRGSAWSEEKVERNFKTWLFRWQVVTAIQRGLCVETSHEREDAYGRVIRRSYRRSGTWSNNYRKKRAFPVWVLGVEPQKSGKLHAHAIIKWSRALPNLHRRTGWQLWTGPKREGGFDHGLARIEPPRCQGHVAGYVSKYVVKAGELYLSPSFDAARLVAV